MSASVIQRKAAFATNVGSGSVAVTLDNPISVGSSLVIACAVVQTDGSSNASPGITVEDDLSNGYSPTAYSSAGSGFFTNTYQGSAIPQAGARTYTLNYTAQSGGSGYTYLAAIAVYELAGVSTTFSGESASQSLGSLHKMSDLSATIPGLSGGTFGNLLVSIFAGIFSSTLSDAQAVAAGSGWGLDARDAVNGTFSPMAIAFESQLVGPASNPSATFSGSTNTTELDGTILVAAYPLTSAIPGGGSGGGGDTSALPFLGSVVEVSDIEGADIFLGTVTVVDSIPSGASCPHLGKVRVVYAPARRSNPSIGQVVVVGSAPANDSNPWLGSVATS
jgi:hypothetical protein